MTLIWHSPDRQYRKVGFDKLISVLMFYLFSGQTLKEIGAAHGLTDAYVCKLAKKYGLKRRPCKPRE